MAPKNPQRRRGLETESAPPVDRTVDAVGRSRVMELDHLRAFHEVARHRSFTEAARRLHLTQPAISMQIQAMERELGERLFEREGRSVRLTHAGEVLLKEAEGVLVRLEELEATARELRSLKRGKIILGASDTVGLYYLPELLRRFRAAYPGIEIALRSLVSRETARRLAEREVDLGLITLSRPLPHLTTLELFEVRHALVTEPGHRLAGRPAVSPRELEGEALILLEPGSLSRELVETFLARAPRPPQVALELSNFEIIKRYVACGLGISILPEVAVDRVRDRLAVVPLDSPLITRVGLAWRGDRRLGAAARAFLELARAHFRPGAGENTLSGPPL